MWIIIVAKDDARWLPSILGRRRFRKSSLTAAMTPRWSSSRSLRHRHDLGGGSG